MKTLCQKNSLLVASKLVCVLVICLAHGQTKPEFSRSKQLAAQSSVLAKSLFGSTNTSWRPDIKPSPNREWISNGEVSFTYVEWQSAPLSGALVARPRNPATRRVISEAQARQAAEKSRRLLKWDCTQYATKVTMPRLRPPKPLSNPSVYVILTEMIRGIDSDGAGGSLELELDPSSGRLLSFSCVQHRRLLNPDVNVAASELEKVRSEYKKRGVSSVNVKYRIERSFMLFGKDKLGAKAHSNMIVIVVTDSNHRVDYLDPTSRKVLKSTIVRI